MRPGKHFQCRLKRKRSTMMCWIEARGARVGAFVEIEDKLWRVEEVYEPGLDADVLQAKQLADRNSLPSIDGPFRG